MKLYTEEQVKEAFKSGNFDWLNDTSDIDYFMEQLTPIELPSDEEIEKEIEKSIYSIEYDSGFIEGAKWMKEQILNQNL